MSKCFTLCKPQSLWKHLPQFCFFSFLFCTKKLNQLESSEYFGIATIYKCNRYLFSLRNIIWRGEVVQILKPNCETWTISEHLLKLPLFLFIFTEKIKITKENMSLKTLLCFFNSLTLAYFIFQSNNVLCLPGIKTSFVQARKCVYVHYWHLCLDKCSILIVFRAVQTHMYMCTGMNRSLFILHYYYVINR